MEIGKTVLKIIRKVPKEKVVLLVLFLMVAALSFSNTTETAATGFEKFVAYISNFRDMTKYLLIVIGSAVFIWGIIQIFNQGDFFQIAIKLLGGIFIFAVGLNIDKGAVAVGGTLVDSAEIGLRMLGRY